MGAGRAADAPPALLLLLLRPAAPLIHGLRPPDSGKCGETKPLSQSDSQQLSPRDKDSPGSAAFLIPTARPGIPCSSSKLTSSRSSSENQPGPGMGGKARADNVHRGWGWGSRTRACASGDLTG